MHKPVNQLNMEMQYHFLKKLNYFLSCNSTAISDATKISLDQMQQRSDQILA